MTPQYVEHRSVHKLEETIQKLSHRGQRPKHTGVQAWDIEGTVRRINMYVIEVPEKGEREMVWTICEVFMTEDFPKMTKDIHGTNSKCWSSSIISRNKVVSEQMKIKLQKTNSKKNNIRRIKTTFHRNNNYNRWILNRINES